MATAGTGGTITGISRKLKEKCPGCKVSENPTAFAFSLSSNCSPWHIPLLVRLSVGSSWVFSVKRWLWLQRGFECLKSSCSGPTGDQSSGLVQQMNTDPQIPEWGTWKSSFSGSFFFFALQPWVFLPGYAFPSCSGAAEALPCGILSAHTSLCVFLCDV